MDEALYEYDCKSRGRSYRLRLTTQSDESKNIILWRGGTFRFMADLSNGECPRYGGRYLKDGSTYDFCVATKGVASFTGTGVNVPCQQTEMSKRPSKQ